MYESSELPAQTNLGGEPKLPLYRRGLTIAGGAIALILISPRLQAKIFPDAGTAYIAPPPGYNVNIRSGPGTRFPAVNTLRPGTAITTTGYYEDGWAQLSDRNWVAGNLINSNPTYGSQGGAATAYIDPPPGYNVNIRSGPGVRYPAVNTLARGTAITITGRYENGWAQLTDGNWVAGNLIRVGAPVNRPTPTPPPVNDQYLSVGTQSPAVARLETRLRELNYVTSNFVADNYYGTDTAQAIRNFQRLNRLPVDGIAGPQTQQVLYSSNAIPNTTSPPASNLQYGTRAQAVVPLELRLQELGYLANTFIADSYFGRDTEEAVRQFQQRNGLPVNGIADQRTRDVLYSSSAIPSYRPPTDPNNPTNPDEPGNPNPPDLGNLRDVTVSTNDGLDALAFSGPGTEYDLLGFIPNGTVVTITGRTEGNWSELEDGSWIYSDFLEL